MESKMFFFVTQVEVLKPPLRVPKAPWIYHRWWRWWPAVHPVSVRPAKLEDLNGWYGAGGYKVGPYQLYRWSYNPYTVNGLKNRLFQVISPL